LKTILDSVKSQDVELILQAGNDLAEYLMNSIFLKPNDDIYSFELKCEHCESKELKQEEDTLDTWFSS
jgi:valyl-tRNA synthetase